MGMEDDTSFGRINGDKHLLERSRAKIIASYYNSSSGNGVWSSKLRRNLND